MSELWLQVIQIDDADEDSDGTMDFVVPVKDEDDMVSDKYTLTAQQSIKAYDDAAEVL